MKVALVYDRVNKWGGAERVLLALHKIFKEAPLFTAVYDKEKAIWAKDFNIKTSFLQEIAFFRSHHEFIPFLMPLAFESFNFDDFDLVISISSEFAKSIITKPKTKHISICLTPVRYLWSSQQEYFKNPVLNFLVKPIILYLKFFDKISSSRPDEFIAISEEVQKRIKKYYNRESVIIYPPIDFIKNDLNFKKAKNDYFLVVSRLSRFTSYKRVDLAIKACNKLKLPLKIVGDGNLDFLKRIAGSTIEFLGKVGDYELEKIYTNARALIFPGLEDFGLVMAEAQFFGKPVIAFRGGGALEIIRENVTGEFFNEQTFESLTKTLQKFDEKRYNAIDCVENAKRFSYSDFEFKIKKVSIF